MEIDAKHVLETLRRGPDQIHIEPVSGELHWLASYEVPSGQRGITDCCFVSEPCRYHSAIHDGVSPVPWIPSLALVQHWGDVRATFPEKRS